MNKTLPAFKYLLRNTYFILLIGFVVVLFNAAVTDWAFYFTAKQNNPSLFNFRSSVIMPLEFTIAIYIFVICMVFFIPTFKVLLANGISRRTYFLANVPVIAIMAAFFSIFITLVLLIHRPFIKAVILSQVVYPNSGMAGQLLVPFFFSFLTGILGWLITLAYYRGNTLARWTISLTPFALLGVLLVLNANSDGGLFDGLSQGYRVLMGTTSSPHNPFIASFSLFCLTALLCGGIFLLLRRAPLRD